MLSKSRSPQIGLDVHVYTRKKKKRVEKYLKCETYPPENFNHSRENLKNDLQE